MNYIATRRFKAHCYSGHVNIPATTELEERDGLLSLNGAPICLSTSQQAYDFFARNDDGCGMERGRLTAEIRKRLAKRDKGYQARWDRIWADQRCQHFRRPEHDDHWVWSFDFYNAEVADLQYILNLVKGVQLCCA